MAGQLFGMNHLCYCMNVHPGEQASDVLRHVVDFAVPVKQRVSPTKPFPLGLRISASALPLLDPVAFQSLLEEHGLVANTINGFPYGAFHGARVKEQVYAPDWSSPERLEYTLGLAKFLARILPEGHSGSVSTVPVSYKPWASPSRIARAQAHLKELAKALRVLEQETGRWIHVGLEPEPDCWLETTEETLSFFKALFASGEEQELQRYIGVCVDTCHVAMQFEDPETALMQYENAGVLVSKIQLSSALEAVGEEGFSRLSDFVEPIYLHQVKAWVRDRLLGWDDLPAFLSANNREGVSTARVHFHVPLFWEGDGALMPTTSTLSSGFWQKAMRCAHVEVETYTYDVLPKALKPSSIVSCIARELRWAKTQISINSLPGKTDKA